MKPRPKNAIISRKQENTQQDLPEDRRAEDREVNSLNFHYTAESECQDIVEGSAPSETKEEVTNCRLRAMDVEALTTLGTFALTDR
jgi:hypothetical protein